MAQTALERTRVAGPAVPARRRRVPAPLALAGLCVAAAGALPVVYLAIRSADGGVGRAVEIFTSSRSLGLLGRTTLLAASVTAAAILIAVPLAWLTVRTDLPGRRFFSVATALPLVIPSYVGGYTFAAALGPRGILQGWLEPLGIERLPSIFGFPGAWLTLTLFTYPYVLLTVRAGVRGLDPALEEASLCLGRNRAETFRRVIVPQLRPAAVVGGLLVALYTIHDFGAVSLLRYDTFTRAIYLQYQGSFDRTTAASLSLMLVALTVGVLVVEARTRGASVYYRLHGSAQRRTPISSLGRWRWPAVAGCGLLLVLALGIPLGVIGLWLVRGIQAGQPLGFAVGAASNALLISSAAAAACLVVAWPVALLGARYPGRIANLVERATFIGYALPGLVVALALVFLGARLVPALYQTLFMLVVAYILLFLPQATGALRSSLLQVSPQLEEASRSLGRGSLSTARRVLVPLVAPGAAAAFSLVFLTAMKELPATLLLAPTGFRTLATQVWGAASEAFFARAAVSALALVVLSSVPLAFLVARERDPRA